MKTTMRWTALLLAAALLVSCAGCKKSGGQGTTPVSYTHLTLPTNREV